MRVLNFDFLRDYGASMIIKWVYKSGFQTMIQQLELEKKEET